MTLKSKVGLYLAATLTAALLAFAVLVVHQQRTQYLEAAAEHANELSEVVVQSTRFAMLNNKPDYVHRILEDVARHRLIEKVRIYSNDGVIIDTTVPAELGTRVELPSAERARTFAASDGRRMLGATQVIRNEPSCSNASCHAHDPGQAVLGVLDIVYPLERMEAGLARSAAWIAMLSLAFVALASLAVALLVHRLVYVPLGDLTHGARRLAGGDLDHPIPVRSRDELGRLAEAFNTMMLALRKSREELREWGRTLEQKVAERTRALRLAEAEAVRGEKLASVGLLAAGIAHELNNPLTGVLTFSTLLRKQAAEGSRDAEDLDLVIRETRRCATIIRRLLDFAREKKPEKKFADLNRVIEETVRIVERPSHVRDIEIRLELDPQLPEVWMDSDLIKQVVMNMLVNAQHALDSGGHVSVRTSRKGEGVEIAIVDDGCGIAPADLPRIFDPFFTTKGVGKGTGLGLSVSHGIVEAHGGTIEVRSELGRGSTFRVHLPIAPANAPARQGAMA
jgi:two-component system, NtrC family, sensor kinase